MKRPIFCCFLLLTVVVTLLTFFHAEAGAQNKVEGTLTVDNETFQLKNIYVFQWDDEVSVFMTVKPVPPEKIPYDIVDLAAEGEVTGFSVGISKGERQITAYSYFNLIYHKAFKGGGQMQMNHFGDLEIKTFDENVIDAALTLDNPATVLCYDCPEKHTYSFKVAFRADIPAKKEEPMKPVEAVISGDDTPPGKAYASYYKAKLAGDIDEVKKWVVQKHVKDFDGEMGKMMLTVSMEMDPKEIRIVKTDISGDSANLTVKGKTNDQSVATGSVVMTLENGQWKVGTDKWKLAE